MDLIIPDHPSYSLANAAVPRWCLDRVPDGAAVDREGLVGVDLLIDQGRIAEIAASGPGAPALPGIDLGRRVVWPTLVDMHTHIDKGQVLQRIDPTVSLHDAGRATEADMAIWTDEDVARRMRFALQCAYVHGVSVVRTHLDASSGMLAERAFRVFDQMRREWAGRIELQGVAIVGIDVFLGDHGRMLADLTARYGGILGGATDVFDSSGGQVYANLDQALDRLLRLAAERDLEIDLHVDQLHDARAFALPAVAEAVLRAGFSRRVVCGHCVNLALQDEAVVARTLALARDAGLAFATMPTPMMYLMDRQAGRTPRWRGVTLAHEIRAAGLPIAIAGDNARDAWYPYGDNDMVDTFRQGVRIFQLDDPAAMAMVGPVPADIVGAGTGGHIRVGRAAKLILFSARSHNAILCRPQADRIVIDNGRRVTMTLPEYDILPG